MDTVVINGGTGDECDVCVVAVTVGEAPGDLAVRASDHDDLTTADANSNYDITRDVQLLFANRDGTKLGAYNDAVWQDPTTKRNSDREKFFEIALIRNESISPNDAATDASANVLAYTARIRWPAFVADTGTGAIQVGSNPTAGVRFDQSQKQVLFFTGVVTR